MSPISIQALSTHRSDQDTLHMLVQSPTVLFVYWQLSARTSRLVQEHFQAEWRDLQPTLLLRERSDHPAIDGQLTETMSELPLPSGDSCFIGGCLPGRQYVSDLGIQNESGQFILLLRSNTLHISHRPIDGTDPNPSTTNEQILLYRPTALSLERMNPIPFEYFSAYSVYAPKNAYPADTESGGDMD
ncbi:DUF4912 domain-containing protein [Paenibacillus sp. HWE-109]|uniref:DUF4912 domain-containing protein n=1 Tax=Paenibacillus sp. HWE-109 TaxID=1306526 RepID=UPI0024B5042D|nr:DUF4912 domain-containing protein [Paenibacillus sp. HWE-109]